MANYHLIHGGAKLQIGHIDISAIAVPHDSREALQFIFHANERRLGVLTDLGHLSPHVIDHYRHCHSLLLEFNHDPQMLRDGPYPYHLQRRVGGDWGHLNNDQAAHLLNHIDYAVLQHLVVSHISEKNNCESRVVEAIQRVLPSMEKVIFADQENGFPWLHLG
jgi:phosphoribosyl 1,2-cyclic phosphodiesterase